MRRAIPFLVGGAALVAAFLPFAGLPGYWMRLIPTIFMAVALAQGMNLMVGYAGYPALGNLAFFGFGAYTCAVLMSVLNWPFFAALAGAAVLSALYALILGLPVLRLRGAYFGIATIGINEATREIVINLQKLTGGGKGIALPFYPGDLASQQSFFYYVMFGIAIAATLLVWWVSRSRLGYALRALKADEDGAMVMGIKTTWTKTAAWCLSTAITGTAGAAYAYWQSFLEPPVVFDITMSVKYYIMAILGGAGTVLGPVLGAVFFEALSESVWSQFLSLHMLVLGVIIVLLALFLPKGIAGLVRRRRPAVKGGDAA